MSTSASESTLSSRHRFDIKRMPYVLISPYFVLFVIFGIFSLAYSVYMSFTARDRDIPGSENILTFQNYQELITDEYFWNALKNTIAIGIWGTIPQMLMALWIAHLLNERIRFKTIYQTGLLLPVVTSTVAIGLIFAQLFGRDFGLINWLLSLVGITPIDWAAGTLSSWFAIAVMNTWHWVGFNSILFLAALQAVSKDLYEAAAVDGAGKFRQFLHVTVPGLRETIAFVSVISVIGSLQLFAEPMMFGGNAIGGSDRQFQTLALYFYEQFQLIGNYGKAAAISVAIAIIAAIFAIPIQLYMKLKER